jgi:hypothetical protein
MPSPDQPVRATSPVSPAGNAPSGGTKATSPLKPSSASPSTPAKAKNFKKPRKMESASSKAVHQGNKDLVNHTTSQLPQL